MNTFQKQISEKAWKHMSAFTTMSAPIRPWRTRLRRDLKSCTEKKRHRIYEKSHFKNANLNKSFRDCFFRFTKVRLQ